MIITILISIIIVSAFSLIIAINPISIGMLILILALSSTALFALTISSWLCFVIFLIYIRGILVLFSYFVSITPNKQLSSIIINRSIIIIVPLTWLTISAPNSISYIYKNNFYLISIYTKSYSVSLFIVINILLVTLIIVVKLVRIKRGPLRPFRNYV